MKPPVMTRRRAEEVKATARHPGEALPVIDGTGSGWGVAVGARFTKIYHQTPLKS